MSVTVGLRRRQTLLLADHRSGREIRGPYPSEICGKSDLITNNHEYLSVSRDVRAVHLPDVFELYWSEE